MVDFTKIIISYHVVILKAIGAGLLAAQLASAHGHCVRVWVLSGASDDDRRMSEVTWGT